MKNKASVVAELLKGILEHRGAPLLCLIQAAFGIRGRWSTYIFKMYLEMPFGF